MPTPLGSSPRIVENRLDEKFGYFEIENVATLSQRRYYYPLGSESDRGRARRLAGMQIRSALAGQGG